MYSHISSGFCILVSVFSSSLTDMCHYLLLSFSIAVVEGSVHGTQDFYITIQTTHKPRSTDSIINILILYTINTGLLTRYVDDTPYKGIGSSWPVLNLAFPPLLAWSWSALRCNSCTWLAPDSPSSSTVCCYAHELRLLSSWVYVYPVVHTSHSCSLSLLPSEQM